MKKTIKIVRRYEDTPPLGWARVYSHGTLMGGVSLSVLRFSMSGEPTIAHLRHLDEHGDEFIKVLVENGVCSYDICVPTGDSRILSVSVERRDDYFEVYFITDNGDLSKGNLDRSYEIVDLTRKTGTT